MQAKPPKPNLGKKEKFIDVIIEILYYGFLLTFPFTLRKILYQAPITSSYNEYTSVDIYVSELVLFMLALITLFRWMFFTKPSLISETPSPTSCSTWNNFFFCKINHIAQRSQFWNFLQLAFKRVLKMFHVEHWNKKNKKIIVPRGTLTQDKKTRKKLFERLSLDKLFHVEQFMNLSLFFLGIFIFFWIFSVFFYTQIPFNHIDRTLYIHSILRLGECVFLVWFVKQYIVPRGTLLKNTLILLLSVLFLQVIVASVQIFEQHSAGLHWLGESYLSVDALGVAKIRFQDEVFLRPYGLFLHPNIFAGFSLMVFLLWILFHVEQYSKKNLLQNKKVSCVPRGTINIFLVLFIMAIILPLSKTVLLAVFVGLASFYTLYLGGKKKFSFFVVGILGIFLSTALFLPLQSQTERNEILFRSWEVIKHNWLLGVGGGNGVASIIEAFPNIPEWKYQPPHTVFAIILLEWGILGLVFLFAIIYNYIKVLFVSRYAHICLSGILMLLVLALYDHYLWDIYPTFMLLAIVIGVTLGKTNPVKPD